MYSFLYVASLYLPVLLSSRKAWSLVGCSGPVGVIVVVVVARVLVVVVVEGRLCCVA